MVTQSIIKRSVSFVHDAMAAVGRPGEGLTVLTARFMFDGGGTRINLHLACGRERSAAHPAVPGPVTWNIPLKEFLSDDGRSASAICDDFLRELAARLRSLEGGASSEPLWLKLARPYGLLGTAPWEAAIGQSLHRPVLRLPDFPERPARRPDVFECALLVDPGPDMAKKGGIVERVHALIHTILRGSARTGTRVHVFCSSAWVRSLAHLGEDKHVQFHQPDRTRTGAEALVSQHEQRVPILRSAPWSEWIAEVMAPRGIDAIFLLCRAQRTNTGAELILSCSPSKRDNDKTFNAIGEEEIGLLLNRAGAWLLTLLPDDPLQPQAMAYVADSLAHRWPGATLFHPFPVPMGDSAVRTALKLLSSERPARAPILDNGFLYCHPGFVCGAKAPAAVSASPVLSEGARLLAQRAPLAERLWSKVSHAVPGIPDADQSVPPNWVGSAQRFLESATLDEVRRTSGDVLLGAPPDQDIKAAVVTDPTTAKALIEIEKLVENYVRTHRDDP
jgi:hypothetical protein